MVFVVRIKKSLNSCSLSFTNIRIDPPDGVRAGPSCQISAPFVACTCSADGLAVETATATPTERASYSQTRPRSCTRTPHILLLHSMTKTYSSGPGVGASAHLEITRARGRASRNLDLLCSKTSLRKLVLLLILTALEIDFVTEQIRSY